MHGKTFCTTKCPAVLYLSLIHILHMKTSMKTIKDRFMKTPYGFVEDDIHWLVARLFKRGDLSFTVNGESINLNNRSEEEIISYITKKQFVDKLLTEVRVRVPENQKKAVRTVMKELFLSLIHILMPIRKRTALTKSSRASAS